MLNRWLMVGASHRMVCFVFLLSVTLAAGLGLPRLSLDTSLSSLIPTSHPDRAFYEQVVRQFGTDNRSVVYVADQNLWTREKLLSLHALHRALENLDPVKQVEDLFTIQGIRGWPGQIEAGPVIARVPETSREIQDARDHALYHPFLAGSLVSRDGLATAILVSTHSTRAFHGEVSDDQARINEILEQTLAPYARIFDQVFQTGSYRVNAELKTVFYRDIKRLAPLSVLVLVVSVLFFLRSPFSALVPLITSAMSIVWTFGLMGWLNVPVNILCTMLPSLIVVIGSTEDTHMISAYLEALEKKQTAGTRHQVRKAATQFMMTYLGVPVLLTMMTTGLGFASNMVSNLDMIRVFALAATIGVVANGLITLIAIPLILSSAGPVKARLTQGAPRGITGMIFRLFSKGRQTMPNLILCTTAVICVCFAGLCTALNVTNDPLSYFQQDHPLIVETRSMNRNLAGTSFFYITLTSDQDRAFMNPAHLEMLHRIQNFMEKQGVFDNSLSIADHLAYVNREFHQGDPSFFKVPAQRELVAQYLTFFHRKDLTNYVSHEYARACIVVRHHISDSSVLNRHIRELRSVVPDMAGPLFDVKIVGENLMINEASRDLIQAQVKSLCVLLLAIFVITSVMFTSAKGGLLSLIPSLIPVVIMFGAMAAMDIPLNPGTAMVAVISIGIAVDGTLHLFSRYNELCRRTSDYEQAVTETVRQEAVPMVTCSLSLALGFSVLMLSDFSIVAQFGALAAAIMLCSLLVNLLITPIIMSKIRLVGLYQILSLKMHWHVLEKSPLFKGMGQYQMRKTILISELNEFETGQQLIEKGTLGRSMYLILSGQVDVLINKGNQCRQVARLGPGQIFGEIGFVRQIRRTADVKAVTPVEVLRFDYHKLEKDLKFFPYIVAKLNFNISRVLGERLAEANEILQGHLIDQTPGETDGTGSSGNPSGNIGRKEGQ